ncbi:hypothetical protein IV203_021225 [Nitzschia inconspicua]|uniref:Uncharacterized protein n=1 Tax=Nitzschia inconspicua TaxID=303405 RepID=A0A9K3KGS8_9STRA|nr:hypothetical protein IV203_021225 [Nitzschia inconspicua]
MELQRPSTDREASSASGTVMLRGNILQQHPNDDDRNLQEDPISSNKTPLHPNKDTGNRPLDPTTFFKWSESFQRPSHISYFPNQVIQLTYMVSVTMPTPTLRSRSSPRQSLSLSNSLYLEDLKEALNVLATDLAPQAYPNLWVRKLTTSVDGWFSAACPEDSSMQNCQDITSSIGIYLSNKPITIAANNFENSTPNLENAAPPTTSRTKKMIDPRTVTSEVRAFQVALENAITNNRLQEIVESFYISRNEEPSVRVLPDQVTSIVINNGEQGEGNIESAETGSEGGDDATSGNSIGGGDVNDDEDEEGPPNIQIGGGGGGEEFAPDIGNELVTGGGDDSEIDSNSGGTSSETGHSDGRPSNGGSWVPGVGNNLPSTTTGGDALPAINDRASNQSALSTGGIVGIVVGSLAAVMITIFLIYRRQSVRSKRDGEEQPRSSSPVKRKAKKKAKSLSAEAEDDIASNNESSRKGSLERFLYSGIQNENTLGSSHSRGGTDHSRGTVPTVTSTMSENTDTSVSSSAAEGGRGTESWKKDEVLVPGNTARGLLTLEVVEEEKRSEDGDDPNDPLLRSHECSDLQLAPTTSSDLEEQARNLAAVNSDEEEVYNSDSAGSSGRSSRSSPSTMESPLKAMAARSIAALRRGRKGSRDRSKQRSKKDLEEALSSCVMSEGEVNGEMKLEDRVSLGGDDAGNVSSPRKMKEAGNSPVDSPGSYGSLMSDARPLTSLDEAIMKGDWAAVGATAALMAASISPEEKSKQSATRRPSLTSPPPEKMELDRLIEQGDWQAVMAAAARYDADAGGTISTGEEGSRSARSRSSTQGSDTMDGSYYSGADYSSAYNSTIKGSVATSASQTERIEEIRSQIETLVREVVPDEVENVDEMMTQFNGKEEELLETLRTMKERDVAKKARMEAHKIARRNTRSKEKEKDDAFSQGRDRSNSSLEATGEPPSDADDESDFSPEPSLAPASGSFAQVTEGGSDRDAAAAAAAEWAIERSLSELVEKEQQAAFSPASGELT